MTKMEHRIKGLVVRKLLRPTHTFWGQFVRYSLAGAIAAVVNFVLYAVTCRPTRHDPRR